MLHFNDHPFHHSQMYELVVSAEVIVQVLLYNAAGCKGIQHESVQREGAVIVFSLDLAERYLHFLFIKAKNKRIEMI